MTEEARGSIHRLIERLVYENKYLRLFDDDVEFPTGNRGTYVRMQWKAPYSVAVLPVLPNGDYQLIRIFAYAKSDWSLQVPKGMGEPGLEPVALARKELLEEAGMAAEDFELLARISLDPGFIDNPVWIFRAINARVVRPMAPESTEVIAGVEQVAPPQSGCVSDLSTIDDGLTLFAMALDLSKRRRTP